MDKNDRTGHRPQYMFCAARNDKFQIEMLFKRNEIKFMRGI